MTKKELSAKVAEVSGVDIKTVEHILNIERDVIVETLKEGEAVFSRGFGSFAIKTRAPRQARNIHQGTIIDVPEKKVVKFKASFNLN